MDLKGLGWIGNIYEKFEAMCLEMEEVMYQDTVKYVENQVQTVGASVKRFYSEVMQDLDPESHIDPVKVAAGDLGLNPYADVEMKRKSSAKKDALENAEMITDDYKVISGKNKTGAYKRPIARRRGHSAPNNSSPASGSMVPIPGNVTSMSSFSERRGSYEVVSSSVNAMSSSTAVEGISGETKETMHGQVSQAGLRYSGASVDSPFAEKKLLTLSSGKKQADSELPFSNCVATETSGSCTNWGSVSQIDQAIKGDAGLNKSVEDKIMMSHKERIDKCGWDAAKNHDIIDQEVEIIENLNASILAETCVLVEEDIRHFIHQGDGKQKSYKKKLREAFSSKKRSTRKEYEKLAAQYKEQSSNQESAQGLIPALSESSTKTFLIRDCPESEWELL